MAADDPAATGEQPKKPGFFRRFRNRWADRGTRAANFVREVTSREYWENVADQTRASVERRREALRVAMEPENLRRSARRAGALSSKAAVGAVVLAAVGTGVISAHTDSRRRFRAWYDEHISVPQFNRRHGQNKKRLFSTIHGTVVELGPGTGSNFACFPESAQPLDYIGVDRSKHILPALGRSATESYLPLPLTDIRTNTVEQELANMPSSSVDCVVSTRFLGHLEQPTSVIREVHRVLKPGGRFFFVEHLAQPAGWRRTLQNMLAPVVRLYSDGYQPVVDVDRMVLHEGFSTIGVEYWEAGNSIAACAVDGNALPVSDGMSQEEAQRVLDRMNKSGFPGGVFPVVAGMGIKGPR